MVRVLSLRRLVLSVIGVTLAGLVAVPIVLPEKVAAQTVPGTYRSEVLADTPLAYWRFEESSGVNLVDEVGNGNPGIAVNGAVVGAPGVLAGSRSVGFDGVNDRVNTGLLQSSVTSRSLEAWIKTTGPSSNEFSSIVSTRPTDGINGRSLTLGMGNGGALSSLGSLFIVLDANFVFLGIESVGSYNDNQWHHVVGTWSAPSGTPVDPSQFRLYVDGVQAPTNTKVVCAVACGASPLTGGEGTTIGNSERYWQGSIDEIAVYGGVLPAARVAAHYQAANLANPGQMAFRTMNGWGVWRSGGPIKPSVAPAMIADPVNSATGGFDHAVTDLVLPGRGEGLVLSRNYDSRQTSSSTLGSGWWTAYQESVSLDSTTGALSWRAGNGAVVEFLSNGAGGFVTPAGVIATAAAAVGGGWTLSWNDQTKRTFSANGKLAGIVDRSGQGVSVAYDGTGRVSVVTDSSGKTFTFTYGTGTAATGGVAGTGRLIQVKGSDNRLVKYGYTGAAGSSQLTSFTDVRAKVWTYAYDVNGFVVTETDPLGNVQFTNTFDAVGRVLTQKDQLNNLSSFVYDDGAGTTTVTDASGAVTVYNRAGNVPRGVAGPAGSTSTQFTGALDASSFTDALGQLWSATYDSRGNMLTRTAPAPLSYVESWTYDSFNNPLTYTDARGNTTAYTYDTNGRVVSEVRPIGVSMLYSWNADGTLATSTDPRGGVSTYTYDGNGNMLSSTTPMGFKTTYTYDTAGRVLTTTEPRGNVAGAVATNFQQKFTYDADGNVLTERDALNRTTTHVYDNAGRRTKTTAPDGGIVLFEYNAANELIKTTAPDGGITLFEYDSRGLRTKETSPIGAITTYGYDAAGRVVSRVDPRGNVAGGVPADFTWSYTYDAGSRLKTVTDPLGRVTTTDYDVLGRVVSTVRPDGSTSQTYDPNGNITSAVSDAGSVSSTFDALNRLATSTDLRGKTSSYGYDLAGNRTSFADPLGRITTSTFDLDGRMTATVDARGTVAGANPADYTTSYQYDAAGYPVQVTDPLGLVTKKVYDRVGNVSTSTNAKNLSTTYLYDTMNRVSRVTAPVVGATNWTYTTMGYVATRADPLSTATVPRVATWAYDLVGRLVEKKDAAGRRFTYGYDVAGNQTQIVDANANAAANPALGTTTLTYDSLNRVIQKSFSDSTPAVSWTYDGEGRVASMADGVGVSSYGYDVADRVNSIVRAGDVWSYSYDAAGNVTSRTVPGGANSTMSFDDAGQVASLTEASGSTVFGHDRVGNMTSMVIPNGVSQVRAFDRASRLTSISNTGPGGSLGGFTYTLDANGNPSAINVSGPSGLIAGESMRNTFDSADRLTRTCFTATTCTAANQTLWTYDKVGSRLTETVGSVTTTYTYDVADQLVGVSSPGAVAVAQGGSVEVGDSDVEGSVPVGETGAVGESVTVMPNQALVGGEGVGGSGIAVAFGASSFTYNANGDRLTAGSDTFTYDVARQPKSASVGGVLSEFSYDGDGNRSSVTTGGVVTQELWDRVGGLAVLVAERSGGVVKRRYTYAGSMPVKFEDVSSSSVGFYLTDSVGSVSNVVSPTGVVGATYRYGPYGGSRVASSVGATFVGNPLRFTGQQLDATGQYNLRARHYNPGLGSFTQTDPLPADIGSPFESPYAYALNNPQTYIDPTGERGQLPGCAWKNNPIASQQPDQLAIRLSGLSANQVRFASVRSQIFIPQPQPFPPIGVPPRTVPSRVFAPKRPPSTRRGIVVAADEPSTTAGPSTTEADPSTTTTHDPHCEVNYGICLESAERERLYLLREASKRYERCKKSSRPVSLCNGDYALDKVQADVTKQKLVGICRAELADCRSGRN